MESTRFRSSFVGRTRELARIETVLRNLEARLVVLTGPGGVGKTRLAARASETVGDSYPGGVWFVPLADVNAASLVLSTIVKAIGIAEDRDTPIINVLRDFFAERDALIILDNFEHLMPAVSQIAELLDHCPSLTLLVTSRQILRLQHEHVIPVPPLETPEVNARGERRDIAAVPSVQLFVERAQAVDATFAMTDESAPDIARICKRLDGLPLAIELAAARTRHAAPGELLVWLDRSIPLLVGGPRDAPKRQQTMRDAIDWSYNLLTEPERQCFRACSVFRGGFDLAAATAVCDSGDNAPLQVLELVSTLVDQSLLLRRDMVGETRYDILEPIRQFAHEALAAHGEMEAVRCAHAGYFVRMAEELRPGIEGPNGRAVMRRFEQDHANLRVSLTYAVEQGHAVLAFRLAAALWKFWYVHRHIAESRAWFQRVVEMPGAVPNALRAEVLYAIGSMAAYQGDFALGISYGQECLALAHASNELVLVGMAHFLLGTIARNQGRFNEARSTYEAALEAARQTRDRSSFADHMCAMILSSLGDMVYEEGDREESLALLEEALSIWQRRGDAWGMAIALQNLAMVCATSDDPGLAAVRFRQSLSFFRDLGDDIGFAHSLAGLGIVAIRLGQPESAARLLGCAEQTRSKAGVPIVRMMQADYEQALKQGRRAIGVEQFDLAWERGRTDTLEQAFEEATMMPLAVPSARAVHAPFGLTAREMEVLRLIANGRSDHEIADELFISYRTVTTHVANIRGKLEVPSRTAAGTMALRLGIVEI